MTYLVHTAHAQLGALWLGCVGWTLSAVAMGLIQWRVWLVYDSEVIRSGVAWVGVWRACFNSHTLVTSGFKAMHCRYISLMEAFTPPEIVAAQVLMLISVFVGLLGNAGGVYALRNIYFGMEKNSSKRFVATGALLLCAAGMALVPLLWNLSSVVTNQTIQFPPEFKLPHAPDSQRVGCGISVGVVGAILMTVSGIIFCWHRLPARLGTRGEEAQSAAASDGLGASRSCQGTDNPTFDPCERV